MKTAILKVFAPYDEHLISELPLTSWEDADRMLAEAYSLYLDRDRWLPKFERIRILGNFRDLLLQNSEHLAAQAAEEGGKPITDSQIEVKRAINGVDVAIRELANLRGEEIPMDLNESSGNHVAYTMHEPLGVVAAISAFNHPVNLIIHQLVPAVAAGCPVIVKPAAATPLSCFSVTGMLYEAGLPREWCNPLVCEREVTGKIVSDRRIGFLTFIGSAGTGWKMRSSLAPGAGCTLEHGGAAPVIVEPDADIDGLLPGLVKGGYYHAGQVCVSVQRVFVHRDVLPEVIEKMVTMVRRLKVGDPLNNTTEVGPMIKPSEADRVEAWVKEALSEGGELLCGGSRISKTCYEPTLLLNPSQSSKCSQEEIFGPVVCLYEYENYKDAIEVANMVPFSFQAAVYTGSLNTALDCVKRLKARAVLVNEHTAFRVDWMPFGGAEMSGIGIGGIGYAMRDMSHEKLMIIKTGAV